MPGHVSLAYVVKHHFQLHSQILDRLPAGVQAVDEAREPWEGILCGREGLALIDLKAFGKTFKTLVIRWYRMGSGKFEVVGYLA